MKKFACAAIIVVAMVGLVVADEFQALITKVDGNTVTFYKMKKGKKDGDEMKADLATKVKVAKGNYDKDSKKWSAGDEIKDWQKDDASPFAKIDADKGATARITIADDDDKDTGAKKGQITQILSAKKGGKGGAN